MYVCMHVCLAARTFNFFVQQPLSCSLCTLPEANPVLFMDKILHDPKDPKLWELWYIPENG